MSPAANELLRHVSVLFKIETSVMCVVAYFESPAAQIFFFKYKNGTEKNTILCREWGGGGYQPEARRIFWLDVRLRKKERKTWAVKPHTKLVTVGL